MPVFSSPWNVVQLRTGTKCRMRIKVCKPDGCFVGDALQKIITLKCWNRKEHFSGFSDITCCGEEAWNRCTHSLFHLSY